MLTAVTIFSLWPNKVGDSSKKKKSSNNFISLPLNVSNQWLFREMQ